VFDWGAHALPAAALQLAERTSNEAALQNHEQQLKDALTLKLSEHQELMKIIEVLKSAKAEQEGEGALACAWLVLLRLLLAGFGFLLLALRAGVAWCGLVWALFSE
jgi:hypothetical protein